MIKQGKNNQYIVSGRNNTSQYLFEVKTEPKIFCNKPVQVHAINYDSLYVVIDFGEFDLASGRRMWFSGETQPQEYYLPSISSDDSLFVHKPESPHTDNPNPEMPHYLILVYELHQGTKLYYLFLEKSKMLEGSEIQLSKNLCEQERTQILTILMLSMENSRLAGYMLTGNRSIFLSTDGSLAWLYHCPLTRSPPHVMNHCYDKIPIFCKNALFFVDPISRQTYPDAQVQNCSDRVKNLFQFDREDENSWFTITPAIEQRKRSAVFGPQVWLLYPEELLVEQEMLESTHRHSYLNSGTTFLSALLQGSFTKIPSRTHSPQHSNSWTRTILLFAPRTDFNVDNMISPSYFKYQIMDTLRSVAYVLELCGIYFSCFRFIKLNVDLLVMILRHMEINRLTGASLRLGKTLLSASYNLFLTSILTSVFNTQTPLLQTLEPEPTSTRIEDETRDPLHENKKKEEHLYSIVHHPTMAFPLVWLGWHERYPW